MTKINKKRPGLCQGTASKVSLTTIKNIFDKNRDPTTSLSDLKSWLHRVRADDVQRDGRD